MKKYISIILFLGIIQMLVSCGVYKDPITTDDLPVVTSSTAFSAQTSAEGSFPVDENKLTEEFGDNPSDRMDGEWFYFLGYYNKLNTVWRYNVSTNDIEPACQDSACNHKMKSGCPFEMAAYNLKAPTTVGGLRMHNALLHTFTVSDGVVYYIIGSLDEEGRYNERDVNSPYYLCSYDTKTMAFKRICNYETFNSNTIYVAGDYLYFEQPRYLEYVDINTDTLCETYFVRCNHKTGEKEELFRLDDRGVFSYEENGIKLCAFSNSYAYFAEYTATGAITDDYKVKFLKYPLQPGATPEVITPEYTMRYFDASHTTAVGVFGNVLYCYREGGIYKHDLNSGEATLVTENVYMDNGYGSHVVRAYGKYLYYFSKDVKSIQKLNSETGEIVSYPYNPTQGTQRAPWATLAFTAGKLINRVAIISPGDVITFELIYDLKTGECIYPDLELIF